MRFTVRKMRRRRIWAIIVVLVVVLAGGTAFVVRKASSAAGRAAQCERIQEDIRANGDVVKAASGARRVAIIGDSYVWGDWLDDRTKSWAHLVGQGRDWEVDLNGISGTGYTNGGACGSETYEARVAKVLSLHPDLVIVEGGLNDSASDPIDVSKAAGTLLDSLAAVPVVVLVGPANAPSKSTLPAVDSALRTAATEHGRQYVSALGWDLDYVPDNLHLTEAGHAAFAKHVADAISG